MAIEKYFFKKLFSDDTQEEILAQFWDKGLARYAKALFTYRQSDSPIRTALGDVCTRVDQLLASLESCRGEAAAEEAFTEDFDAASVAAIRQRYPKLDYECTSDKKYLNLVFAEACGAEIWQWNHKNKRWYVNDKEHIHNVETLCHYIRVREHEKTTAFVRLRRTLNLNPRSSPEAPNKASFKASSFPLFHLYTIEARQRLGNGLLAISSGLLAPQ